MMGCTWGTRAWFGSVWGHPAFPSDAIGCLQLCMAPLRQAPPWAGGLSSPLAIPIEEPGLLLQLPCLLPHGARAFVSLSLGAQVPEDAPDPITADPQKCFICPGKQILLSLLSGWRKEVYFPSSC